MPPETKICVELKIWKLSKKFKAHYTTSLMQRKWWESCYKCEFGADLSY